MSVERYLAGNKVYRSGSHAPTVGTVDPTGYIERELRKRMFDQQASQTRSGLAATALRRIQQPSYSAPRTQPMASAGIPTNAALQAKIAAVKAQHLAELQQQKLSQAARPKVSPVGKITSSQAKPTALPWDMNAMTEKINAGDVLGQLRNQLMAARQDAQKNYTSTLNDLNQQQPAAERGLLNQFGGRGLAFSSGYGMGVGDLQNKFAGARSGAQQQLTDLLNSYQNQETQGSSTYNKKLAAIQQALAQRLAQRAGSLGFGPVK